MSNPLNDLAQLIGDQDNKFSGTVVFVSGNIVKVRTARGIRQAVTSSPVATGQRVSVEKGNVIGTVAATAQTKVISV